MNIDALTPYVLPNVMGCPIPVMEHHVRLSAIDFCNKTRWHEDECIAVNIGLGRVLLQPDTGLEIISISKVYVDGREVRNKTKQLLDSGSTENFYVVVSDGELAINPTPVTDVPVRVVVALRPTMDATTISDELNEWRDGIASGAIARIAALPGQAFTNADMSGYHRDQFDEAVKTAKVKKYMGSSEAPQKRFADVF